MFRKKCNCKHWLCVIIIVFKLLYSYWMIFQIQSFAKFNRFAITIMFWREFWLMRESINKRHLHASFALIRFSHDKFSFKFKFARISRIWHLIYYDVDVKTIVHLARCCKCSCATKISKHWIFNVKSQNSITFQNSITELSMRNHFACVNIWNVSLIERVSIIFSFHT